MKCANHLDKDSTSICNHCGKSICLDCQVQVKGEVYCKDCLGVKLGQEKKETHSPALAAILSFIIAGLGQVYNGQIGKGLLIFFTGWLVIPWIFGIFDAYRTAKAMNEGTIVVKKRPGCMIAAVIGIVIFFIGIFFLGLLAGIAIPNFLKARQNANEAAAQLTIRVISSAIETYRVSNNGNYPLDERSLIGSTPPYLREAYNNTIKHGYIFFEDFQPNGYKIMATPTDCGITGEEIFTMETNGVLSSQRCKKE